MPRFSLGSHPPQQQQQQRTDIEADDSNSYSDGSRVRHVKSWWRRIRKTFSSSKTQNFPGLSPDRPPLPPLLGAISEASGSSSGNSRSLESNGSRFSRAKRIAPQTESAPTLQRRRLRQSTGSIDDLTARTLYPILEESDTIMTDSTQSRARPQSSVFNESNNNNNNNGNNGNNGNNNNSNNNNNNGNEEKRISTSSNETDSSSSTTSSAVSYHPPPVLPPTTSQPTQKREPQFRQTMVGDETKCRRKFVKMVQAAYNFQMEHKELIPKEMEIIFNAQDNVQSICLDIDGEPEYHKFCGNSQYIPPELSTHGIYNHNLADVWVLGVSLYRMLVGKYPFIASTDRKLFKKMLHADFSIPASLSEDAKDLLRRMLSPDTARASLDLVLFHPWLKPYKVQVPAAETSRPQIPTTSATSSSPPATQQRSISESAAPVVMQKKSRDDTRLKRVLTSMLLLFVEGPYPPPRKPYQELAQLHTHPQGALAR